MHVMLMAQCYAPEEVSAAILITELASDLARRGHRVTMVTGAPNYPKGVVFEGYRNDFYAAEESDGVRVVRTWSYISPRKNFWARLLHYATYSATAFYGGIFAGKPDVLVSFSPPLPLGLSAWLLSRIWRVPWVLQLEDLFPDAAIAASVLTNGAAIDFSRMIEEFQYGNAERILLIGEDFRKSLLTRGVPDAKLQVIPNWVDPDEVRPLRKQNEFRRLHGLGDKFVVMYAGNIGLTSCLEDVIGAAEILKERANIQFVIVGEGVKKQALEARARIRLLDNVLFLPYQPRSMLAEMLAAADVSLVTLNAGAARSSLPSKILYSMASARPILAISPPDGELARIVQEARCGRNVPPESSEVVARTITELMARGPALTDMGRNGRKYIEKHHARQVCIDAYEKMLSATMTQAGKESPSAKAVV